MSIPHLNQIISMHGTGIAIYRDDVGACRLFCNIHIVDGSVVKLRRELVDVLHYDVDGGGIRENVVAFKAAVRHRNDQLVAPCCLIVKTARQDKLAFK